MRFRNLGAGPRQPRCLYGILKNRMTLRGSAISPWCAKPSSWVSTALWWRSIRSIHTMRRRISLRLGRHRRLWQPLQAGSEIITAIKPYLYHPVVLAKMALQISSILVADASQ